MTTRLPLVVLAMCIGASVAIVQRITTPAIVLAHGGGLDSRGCHNDRQRGGYHCHQGQLAGQSFRSASEAAAAMTSRVTPSPATAAPAQARPSTQGIAGSQQSAITAQSLLAVGKAAGACGILELQLQFQSNTKMAGGDEFVVRFWTTEAARLGMTLERYAAEHCKTSISSYGRLFELAGQADAVK